MTYDPEVLIWVGLVLRQLKVHVVGGVDDGDIDGEGRDSEDVVICVTVVDRLLFNNRTST